MYYGLKSSAEAKALAHKVVSVLGGGHDAWCLIIETPCAETLLGNYPDSHPDKWGVGLCQHDQIGLDDIQQNGKAVHFELVKRYFGYDIENVILSDLANDPLLSLICCRLSYKRVPERIPSDLLSRAHYWKEHYNTEAGAGTVEEYLDRVAECLGEEWQ